VTRTGRGAALALGTLAFGVTATTLAHASPAATVLVLVATTLVGALGLPGWATAALALVVAALHTVVLDPRGAGPDRAEDVLLLAAAAATGWFCGRRAARTADPRGRTAST
jgi:Zn-dependent protease